MLVFFTAAVSWHRGGQSLHYFVYIDRRDFGRKRMVLSFHGVRLCSCNICNCCVVSGQGNTGRYSLSDRRCCDSCSLLVKLDKFVSSLPTGRSSTSSDVSRDRGEVWCVAHTCPCSSRRSGHLVAVLGPTRLPLSNSGNWTLLKNGEMPPTSARGGYGCIILLRGSKL